MQATDQFGVIEPQLLYNYDALTRQLGFTRKTIRAAVRNGLKVYRVHKRAFILGQDWIDYVLANGSDPSNTSSNGGSDA